MRVQGYRIQGTGYKETGYINTIEGGKLVVPKNLGGDLGTGKFHKK